jgi:UDP-N-acetylglucosamine 2-epimerase (non-hydrolysing)
MNITIVAGARPNFMKIAPIIRELEALPNDRVINYRLIHTGQHYDHKMSGAFFDELNIPKPHNNLQVGSGTQAEQTALVMVRFEKELLDNPTDMVLVVGDVTSTMACTLVAKKLGIKVAHIEAGIRSGDMSMPEEINRIVTDSISDYFFTTTENAGVNLIHSGTKENKIFFVGNTMIDSLLYNLEKLKIPPFWDLLALTTDEFLVITLHRPSNVDDIEKLNSILIEIIKSSDGIKKIFPVHPRTAANIKLNDLNMKDIFFVEPMNYLEFIYLIKNSKGVITDSGGITEETTVLGVPCMTLRDSTERPETVTIGTNELIGSSVKNIGTYLNKMISGNWKKGSIPQLWDGKTAFRIVNNLPSLIKN